MIEHTAVAQIDEHGRIAFAQDIHVASVCPGEEIGRSATERFRETGRVDGRRRHEENQKRGYDDDLFSHSSGQIHSKKLAVTRTTNSERDRAEAASARSD